MNISERGLELIREHEECRLEAYRDAVGVLTIGFGHTRGVKEGDICTQEQAEAWLLDDVADAENCIQNVVKVPLLQGQADALISWVYNLGCRALKNSTLLRKLNEADYDGASLEILRWDQAGGKQLAGLTARREAERELFEATA